jgi:multidrug efflux system outer membrane protein
VINKKAIQAEFLTANVEQLKAMYDYQRVVLNAFTEVVNRVARLENYGRSVAIRREQLLALEASVEIANNLFQNPREEERVEYLEVLLAQRNLRDARMGLIDAKREQLTATVQAYEALGGGVFLSNSLLESP